MSHMGISTNGVLHLVVACDNEAVVWAGGEGRGGTATAAACLVHSSYALALPCSKTLPKGETHCRSTWCSDTGASQRLLHEGEFQSAPATAELGCASQRGHELLGKESELQLNRAVQERSKVL